MEGDPKYRISSSNFTVKLPKRFLKVLNILPGPFNTFLLLGYYRVGQDVLLQIDAESSILLEHKFTVPVASISMINPTEVMALESRSNAISVFNLVSKDHYQVPFNFMNEESDLCDIFTFNKSKHICVVERGMYNDSRFKLSYFATPLT